MPATHLPLRSLLAGPVLLLSLLSATPVFSQAPAVQSGPAITPAQSAGQLNNPLQRETQPDLAVDRDPVPSPDVVPSAAPASTPSTPGPTGQIQRDQNGVYTLHEDVDEVLLDCTVVDEKGRPVLDVNRNDFRVFEDGVPQATTSFSHQDQPVSMGILLDSSGSMLDKRSAVAAAAMKLLEESNPRDAAFVVNFNDRAYLDQGFTVDRVALNRGLSHFDSRGATALYDAVAASADELAHHAKQRKQVLLIVTDGADNASRLGLRDAIRRVQGLAGPVVYTIGLLYDSDPKEYQKAHDDLESLSAETGGLAYFPRSLDEVSEIASEVARDVRNQYSVGYRSSKPASFTGYRQIHVEAWVSNHKHLTVRTRRGYFAQPAGQKKAAQSPGDATSRSSPPQQQ
jgi:Ca-activated chloride channel family protein